MCRASCICKTCQAPAETLHCGGAYCPIRSSGRWKHWLGQEASFHVCSVKSILSIVDSPSDADLAVCVFKRKFRGGEGIIPPLYLFPGSWLYPQGRGRKHGANGPHVLIHWAPRHCWCWGGVSGYCKRRLPLPMPEAPTLLFWQLKNCTTVLNTLMFWCS